MHNAPAYKFDYNSRMKIPRTRANDCGFTTHLSLVCQQYYSLFSIKKSKISILKFITHANEKFIIFITF